MRAYKKTAIAVALGFTLVACGGGGGGGSDDAPANSQAATGDFTAGSYQAETDRALEPLLLAFAFEGTDGSVRPFAAGETPARAAAAGFAGSATLQAGRFERRLAERLLRRDARVQPLATENLGSTACTDGGSLELTVTYADAQKFTPGDRIVATSNACIEDGQAIGGSFSLVLSEFRESPSSISLKARIVADDFGSTALRIDGTGRIALVMNEQATAGTVSITYDGMSVVAGAEQFVWDHGYTYIYDETGETFELDGHVAVNDRHYRLRQGQPFVVDGSGSLMSGSVSLIDKDGDRVQVDAFSGASTYTFFIVGNATPVGSVAGLPLGN